VDRRGTSTDFFSHFPSELLLDDMPLLCVVDVEGRPAVEVDKCC
jgi:hypothetical protein